MLQMSSKNVVCIICKKPDKLIRRGLCVAHYTRWIRALEECPTDETRSALEEKAIAAGKLLPDGRSKRMRDDDEFMELLEELKKESPKAFAKAPPANIPNPPASTAKKPKRKTGS